MEVAGKWVVPENDYLYPPYLRYSFKRTHMIYLKQIRLLDPDLVKGDVKYPYAVPAVRHIEAFLFDRPLTFLVGENGMGKSTVLEALMKKLPSDHTMIYDGEDYGAVKIAVNDLHEQIAPVFERKPDDVFVFRAESFFNYADRIDREARRQSFDYGRSYVLDRLGGRMLLQQSHGESFMSLFLNYSEKNTLFILDEPEAALSPARQMGLLVRMRELVERGCQFIVSTHSPILLGYPGARIYQVEETGVAAVAYEETEPYTLTKYFLDHTDRMLHELGF